MGTCSLLKRGPMKKIRFVGIVVGLLSGLIMGSVQGEELVRAKVALEIKSEGDSVWARSKDRITSRDKLRIYVIPAVDLQVYIVYTNFEKAVLMLNKRIAADTVLSLPEKGLFFQADGSKKQEGFTVVCSFGRQQELEAVFENDKTSYDKWKQVEKKLKTEGKLQISQSLEKPVPMAGAVRGVPKTGDSNDQIRNDLLTYSGKSVLVRRYVFDVQK